MGILLRGGEGEGGGKEERGGVREGKGRKGGEGEGRGRGWGGTGAPPLLILQFNHCPASH